MTAKGDPGTGPRESEKAGRKGKSLATMAREKNMDVGAFAKANIHTDGLVGKLARMYYTKEAVHGTGKSTMKGPGDKRSSATKLYDMG